MAIHPYNWKQYFMSQNEGLGTLYDRIMLQNIFDYLLKKFKIRSALEAPILGINGVTGINSIYLAYRGVDITLIDNDKERIKWISMLWDKISNKISINQPEIICTESFAELPVRDDSYDMVWNISALWYLKDENLENIINELWRVSRKLLLIFVHNQKQIFYPIWRKIDKEIFKYVNEDYTDERFIEDIFRKLSLRVYRKDYIVVTPWPGIIIKKEELLFGMLFKENRNVKLEKINLENIRIPIYITYLENEALQKSFRKYMVLEVLPKHLKKFWGHLVFWLILKKGGYKNSN